MFFDGTYKLNRANYPLYIILGVDSIGCGRVIGAALVEREKLDLVSEVLSIFKDVNPISEKELETILIDKDMTELIAIKQVYSGANVRICAFHCLQAMLRALAKLKTLLR